MRHSVAPSAAGDPDAAAPPWQERVAGALLVALVGPALALLPIRLGLRPALAAAAVLSVGAGFGWWALRARTDAARRRRGMLRLGGPRASRRLVAVAAVAGVVAIAAATIIYARVIHQPTSPPRPWEEYVRRSPAHRMVGALAIVAVAPVMEEFAFRGVLLTRLETHFGTARAIAGAAALFAVLHGEPWVMPVVFALGLLLGTLAWASDSVWAAVLLHAGWNAFAYFDPLALLGGVSTEGPWALPIAGAALACSVATLLAVVPRLHAWAREGGPCEQRADAR